MNARARKWFRLLLANPSDLSVISENLTLQIAKPVMRDPRFANKQVWIVPTV
jgi:hypothetical protein